MQTIVAKSSVGFVAEFWKLFFGIDLTSVRERSVALTGVQVFEVQDEKTKKQLVVVHWRSSQVALQAYEATVQEIVNVVHSLGRYQFACLNTASGMYTVQKM